MSAGRRQCFRTGNTRETRVLPGTAFARIILRADATAGMERGGGSISNWAFLPTFTDGNKFSRGSVNVNGLIHNSEKMAGSGERTEQTWNQATKAWLTEKQLENGRIVSTLDGGLKRWENAAIMLRGKPPELNLEAPTMAGCCPAR